MFERSLLRDFGGVENPKIERVCLDQDQIRVSENKNRESSDAQVRRAQIDLSIGRVRQ